MDRSADESLASLLDRLASAQPAPGGGAAASLAGAAAAALVAMVCRVTTRHVPSDSLIVSAVERADWLRSRLAALMREDIEAYQALLDSRRAPAEVRASPASRPTARDGRAPRYRARRRERPRTVRFGRRHCATEYGRGSCRSRCSFQCRRRGFDVDRPYQPSRCRRQAVRRDDDAEARGPRPQCGRTSVSHAPCQRPHRPRESGLKSPETQASLTHEREDAPWRRRSVRTNRSRLS
jgi:hypothetical protein